jgi:hypothetical protein
MRETGWSTTTLITRLSVEIEKRWTIGNFSPSFAAWVNRLANENWQYVPVGSSEKVGLP